VRGFAGGEDELSLLGRRALRMTVRGFAGGEDEMSLLGQRDRSRMAPDEA